MTAPGVIRGRGRIAGLLAVSEKTVSRMRARGEIKVETKAAGRPANWYVTRSELERVKKQREG
ncbi:hypothetical protein GCM10008171_19480 [Methylopila jiangsuensis]|uniref:Helix-turn-helix domain-containing protein n=1 Tax=Methylopila jiangsuensis TaxID=586230 RepID=A0A9W6JIJ2_9HYPH|nr:helix-turn-helix domain-containing protein [Methylopila jiangsuensis]GLK76694.1 hypothetical protein GCM10008171_19480 [Methylopila jiangsuensis]